MQTAVSFQKGDRIAVIGGGLIGTSWAALFMAWGHDVALFEHEEASRNAIPPAVSGLIAQVAELAPGLPASGRLHLATSLEEAVEGAAWVQENVPESVPLKRAIYAGIEAVAPAGITIASSTSSLVWSELSADMTDPLRLITAHPFNPPHLMPLVELFGPDAARIQAAAAFYRSLGRHPVFLRREAVGHIANRLSSALWQEAVNMVAEGIADVAEIDAALVHGPGLRWSVVGAHMAYHLGGGAGGIGHYLAHLGPSQERRWRDLGQPRLDAATCDKLVAGIAAEAGDRDIAALEAERDAGLIAVQRALRGRRP
ncbi:3-hydroxyacyl-CoA dehydrogenase NAD-binding domain-containing protein [Paracoccus benzoatiresistens]|uniref:3-hydroxyacyl-CoA dehydrogenase NAD-binding domain-containing protein n=1 Tax=Paracoccus benzoatiresistens TaxID=2997341 RepID=A0ABT4J921_9RHOB|nr:3-hydroxyacyl-CoA dehydrogenase NAD-binding domain-containing protein [Paracoccus sp. EF6]MCZ0963595.1 3-hydroxyacyl-CoA dehydrogenase NAD-binding domain-containing protein [Paracoccus sp. EF6]